MKRGRGPLGGESVVRIGRSDAAGFERIFEGRVAQAISAARTEAGAAEPGLRRRDADVRLAMQLGSVADWRRAAKAVERGRVFVRYVLQVGDEEESGVVELDVFDTLCGMKRAVAESSGLTCALRAVGPFSALPDWTPLCGAFGPLDRLYKPDHMHASVALSTRQVTDLSTLFNRLP
jgi:hypothetical protein